MSWLSIRSALRRLVGMRIRVKTWDWYSPIANFSIGKLGLWWCSFTIAGKMPHVEHEVGLAYGQPLTQKLRSLAMVITVPRLSPK